jgi:hypothetical protein
MSGRRLERVGGLSALIAITTIALTASCKDSTSATRRKKDDVRMIAAI